MTTYRHGDISLHKVKKTEGALIKHNGSFVLAEGETTGHKHIIVTDRPEDLVITKDSNGRYFFELKSMGKISHEEHKTIEVMPGIYEMKNEREFNWFEMAIKKVQD